MRKKKREMDNLQVTFNQKQEALLKAGVSKTDAILLQEENKIQRVVQQCRRSHNGPIESEEELDALTNRYESDSKSLRSALRYEIRYRKFTVRNIKEDNPLFKQMNLTTDELKENLRLLLTKTDRSRATTVTMEDLQGVIGTKNNRSEEIEDAVVNIEDSVDRNEDVAENYQLTDNDSGTSNWPPKIGEHIAANFDDGFHIGEVIGIIDDDTVNVTYMKPKKILTASPDEHPRRFWIWPYPEETYATNRFCIQDLRPADLQLAIPPSTKRMLVFSLGNAEVLSRLWSEAEVTI